MSFSSENPFFASEEARKAYVEQSLQQHGFSSEELDQAVARANADPIYIILKELATNQDVSLETRRPYFMQAVELLVQHTIGRTETEMYE